MLASTVQFSKNERTPSHYCHRLDQVLQPDWFGDRESPDHFLAERNTRVFSQDPTACRQTCETLVRPFHVLADRTNSDDNQAECM
jgi:hypothetical protein